MSVRQNKNEMLTGTMWNIINPNDVSRLTDLINAVLPIPNIKLADPAMFLSSYRKVLRYYNTFNWLIPPIDRDKASESMSNLLNSVLLYCELVDKLKT